MTLEVLTGRLTLLKSRQLSTKIIRFFVFALLLRFFLQFTGKSLCSHNNYNFGKTNMSPLLVVNKTQSSLVLPCQLARYANNQEPVP